MSELPLTYTVEQAGRLLGISRGLAYSAARDGQIPTVRLGSRLLVPRARLLALLGEGSELSLNASEAATNGPAGKTPEDTRHDRSYR